MGMTNATDMAGGFQQWKSEGLAIVPYGGGMKFKEALAGLLQRLIPPSLRHALQKIQQRDQL
jgi:hypothetical protein